MNVVLETENRIKYQNQKLNDLENCLKENLSKDAKNYIYTEIAKTNKNLNYYENVLKVIK